MEYKIEMSKLQGLELSKSNSSVGLHEVEAGHCSAMHYKYVFLSKLLQICTYDFALATVLFEQLGSKHQSCSFHKVQNVHLELESDIW